MTDMEQRMRAVDALENKTQDHERRTMERFNKLDQAQVEQKSNQGKTGIFYFTIFMCLTQRIQKYSLWPVSILAIICRFNM